MKKINFAKNIIVCLVLSAGLQALTVQAQNDRTAYAFLRHKTDGATLEVFVTPQIEAASVVSAAVYKTDKNISRRFAQSDDVKNCAAADIKKVICFDRQPGKNPKIIYNFETDVKNSEVYKIGLKIVTPKANGQPEIFDSIIDAGKDFADVKVKYQKFINNRENRKLYQLSDQDDVKTAHGKSEVVITLEFKRPPDFPPEVFDEYVEARMREIYLWAEPNRLDAKSFAVINVENATGRRRELKDKVPVRVRLSPTGRGGDQTSESVEIYLLFDDNFPIGKSFLGVDLKNKPPMELEAKITNLEVEIKPNAAADASKIGEDTVLGPRSIERNLDLGLSLASFIEEKEDAQGIKNAKRNNLFNADLRFAPYINRRQKGDDFNYWFTPFFADAKVSNKKISKDSLSLNRIILGTEYAIRQLTNENKYIYTFRGLNASDRDFKRIEAKFNFEFRPQFGRFNHPRSFISSDELSKIDGTKKRELDPEDNFGYKIEPYGGFEIGRVYRDKREPFVNEESSRFVRRAFFGTDALFNLTRFVNLKLSDIIYVRGESAEARQRNYFNGEIQFPFAESENNSQYLFIGFEKGDQPPFVSRSVNSFKIGYRITSNLFGQRTP